MKSKISALLVVAVLLLPLSSLQAVAQKAAAHVHTVQYTRTPLRNITGTVHDGGDEPLRGAVVQVEQEGTMAIQSFVTDDRGTYHFRNLSSSTDYQVWATFRGHHSKHHDISKFDKKADREIAIVIDLTKD